MRYRCCQILLICVLLVVFSGCPGGTSIALGTWLITVKITGGESFSLALQLLADGQAQSADPFPPMADANLTFGGSWAVNGSTFNLTQNRIGDSRLFTGTLHTSTNMSGTFASAASPSQPDGDWAATWLPSQSTT